MVSDNQENSLYIRTYKQQIEGHTHHYHQITIPLFGNIKMRINDEVMTVYYGEVLIIKKNTYHQFQANEDFRFLVMNVTGSIDRLLPSAEDTHFALDDKTLSYVAFVEKQLMSMRDANIEALMFDLLFELLSKLIYHNPIKKKMDARLYLAIQHIKKDIAARHSIQSLAKTACLSESQFKVIFKDYFDCTPYDYITNIRMQKAVALLLNTDKPIAIIAEECGYQSVTAFTRRFTQFYQHTPAKLRDGSHISSDNQITK
ncbi:helix-turn-helix transcriptional regulator [Psychrobacter sp. I-STPA10]|uniref:helix-turn-helix transcriptional regulator n=1 Tax=Psychrobacter sp. I-STPA10 TaxID=2585769 RepID=UPI001E2ED65F|nr:AraC family transcriptional regulator [Psychrobacter sp. I-STPA10]